MQQIEKEGIGFRNTSLKKIKNQICNKRKGENRNIDGPFLSSRKRGEPESRRFQNIETKGLGEGSAVGGGGESELTENMVNRLWGPRKESIGKLVSVAAMKRGPFVQENGTNRSLWNGGARFVIF